LSFDVRRHLIGPVDDGDEVARVRWRHRQVVESFNAIVPADDQLEAVPQDRRTARKRNAERRLQCHRACNTVDRLHLREYSPEWIRRRSEPELHVPFKIERIDDLERAGAGGRARGKRGQGHLTLRTGADVETYPIAPSPFVDGG